MKMFVVQKHRAHRAGLHWDFRLEHDGVLWSWAVPKGPSLDPADRRVAIHVEDHPIDYASFHGSIPDGQYGAGTVETWDRGTWEPLGDPNEGMRKGNLRFVLHGDRLSGRFTLARLSRRDPRKQEGWFLIKGHDDAACEGVDAVALEQRTPLAEPPRTSRLRPRTKVRSSNPPAAGAIRGTLPDQQEPQLCSVAKALPQGDTWVSEVKLDGYRLLAAVQGGQVRLLTRNGHDWADRMPAVAAAFGKLDLSSAMLDGELVALRQDGASSFPGLQAALKAGRDDQLVFVAFDLLHLDGWDLRNCSLLERKRVLATLSDWSGMLRYSDHQQGRSQDLHRDACRMHLEGIICKQADAPYRGGRGRSWLKVKCSGREELVVLGWTPPGGGRVGIGALHAGYYDPQGRLHYAGGIGAGFSDQELIAIRKRLDRMVAEPPSGMLVAGDPIDTAVTWVRPELVIEVQFTDWSGAGRVRHPVYLGLREDKATIEVVREVADPDAARVAFSSRRTRSAVNAPRKGWHGAVPPVQGPTADAGAASVRTAGSIVVARAPKREAVTVGGVALSHPDRQLWPGITKKHLAEYWQAVAAFALPGIARRPLSILRCPDGIDGREKFFQKNGHGIMPAAIREGVVAKQPYLAIDDVQGLIAMAQMSALELHPWGAGEADPIHPDRLVFDLDPGEGVPWAEIARAAHEVRDRLHRLGLASFCRTTGGKGLHVVVPVRPEADWDAVKPFCRAFAEALAQEFPDRYLAHLKIADRRGRILVDWLRNGLGATAVASFCPRARPGASVAIPVGWDEVTPTLDAASLTVRTVPERLNRLGGDPWAGFATSDQSLPELATRRTSARTAVKPVADPPISPARRAMIVVASKPRSRQ